MPLYKFVGNRILSAFQNRMLGTTLSEFHSGYRLYSVAALSEIPFALNTNDFHFDTEIIIQFLLAGSAHQGAADPDLLRRRDLPRERAEIRLGRRQGGAVARAQQLGLFYDRRFDSRRRGRLTRTTRRSSITSSPHSDRPRAASRAGARVLDLGCAGGYVGAAAEAEEGCTRDRRRPVPAPAGIESRRFRPPRSERRTSRRSPLDDFDHVLLLDVIEHLPVAGKIHRAAARRAEARSPIRSRFIEHRQHRLFRRRG